MILDKPIVGGRMPSAGPRKSRDNRRLMIFALAGRRIDSPEAKPERFPLRNAGLVRQRLERLFANYVGATLVCSAACGADLLALEAAGSLGWRRRVILPFDRARFRETSVTDRPGDWSALYERILGAVEAAGDLVMAAAPPDRDPYEFAGDRILEEAGQIAAGSGEPEAVVVVWDGTPRGAHDATQHLVEAAEKKGLAVLPVSTLE